MLRQDSLVVRIIGFFYGNHLKYSGLTLGRIILISANRRVGQIHYLRLIFRSHDPSSLVKSKQSTFTALSQCCMLCFASNPWANLICFPQIPACRVVYPQLLFRRNSCVFSWDVPWTNVPARHDLHRKSCPSAVGFRGCRLDWCIRGSGCHLFTVLHRHFGEKVRYRCFTTLVSLFWSASGHLNSASSF